LSPFGRIGLLILITLTAWILLLLPAFAIAGLKGIDGLSWSAVVCFIAGAPTVWLVSQIENSPTRVWFVMAGMMLRSVAVAIAVLLFWQTRPDFGWAAFYSWLVIFYNILLTAETYLVLPGAEISNTRN
jgi:hypothetical protein